MYADFPDPADVGKGMAQCVDGDVTLIERAVSGIDAKGDRVWVGEREGTLRPAGAHEGDACPQGLAPKQHLTPSMADMANGNPMWGANCAFPGESSGRVKVAVEGTNGTNGRRVVAIK